MGKITIGSSALAAKRIRHILGMAGAVSAAAAQRNFRVSRPSSFEFHQSDYYTSDAPHTSAESSHARPSYSARPTAHTQSTKSVPSTKDGDTKNSKNSDGEDDNKTLREEALETLGDDFEVMRRWLASFLKAFNIDLDYWQEMIAEIMEFDSLADTDQIELFYRLTEDYAEIYSAPPLFSAHFTEIYGEVLGRVAHKVDIAPTPALLKALRIFLIEKGVLADVGADAIGESLCEIFNREVLKIWRAKYKSSHGEELKIFSDGFINQCRDFLKHRQPQGQIVEEKPQAIWDEEFVAFHGQVQSSKAKHAVMGQAFGNILGYKGLGKYTGVPSRAINNAVDRFLARLSDCLLPITAPMGRRSLERYRQRLLYPRLYKAMYNPANANPDNLRSMFIGISIDELIKTFILMVRSCDEYKRYARSSDVSDKERKGRIDRVLHRLKGCMYDVRRWHKSVTGPEGQEIEDISQSLKTFTEEIFPEITKKLIGLFEGGSQPIATAVGFATKHLVIIIKKDISLKKNSQDIRDYIKKYGQDYAEYLFYTKIQAWLAFKWITITTAISRSISVPAAERLISQEDSTSIYILSPLTQLLKTLVTFPRNCYYLKQTDRAGQEGKAGYHSTSFDTDFWDYVKFPLRFLLAISITAACKKLMDNEEEQGKIKGFADDIARYLSGSYIAQRMNILFIFQNLVRGIPFDQIIESITKNDPQFQTPSEFEFDLDEIICASARGSIGDGAPKSSVDLDDPDGLDVVDSLDVVDGLDGLDGLGGLGITDLSAHNPQLRDLPSGKAIEQDAAIVIREEGGASHSPERKESKQKGLERKEVYDSTIDERQIRCKEDYIKRIVQQQDEVASKERCV